LSQYCYFFSEKLSLGVLASQGIKGEPSGQNGQTLECLKIAACYDYQLILLVLQLKCWQSIFWLLTFLPLLLGHLQTLVEMFSVLQEGKSD